MYRKNPRDVHIVSGEAVRPTYMCIYLFIYFWTVCFYYCFLNLNLNFKPSLQHSKWGSVNICVDFYMFTLQIPNATCIYSNDCIWIVKQAHQRRTLYNVVKYQLMDMYVASKVLDNYGISTYRSNAQQSLLNFTLDHNINQILVIT